MAEPFHLHLLEFARAENEIARRDFIAEAFADLCDAEGNLYARGVDDVFEFEKDALGRFGAEICLHRIDSANLGCQHQIKLPRLRKRARLFRIRTDDILQLFRLHRQSGSRKTWAPCKSLYRFASFFAAFASLSASLPTYANRASAGPFSVTYPRTNK